jgi:hypothetical protein
MTDLSPFDIREQQERDADKSHVNAVLRKEDENLWTWMVSGPQGRKFLWKLMQTCGHGESSFHTNGSLMSFAEGRKSVSYDIEKRIKALAPKDYLKMLEENQ